MKTITAVMVTGLERGQVGLPQMAVRCFLNQTYPAKELLIINHGEQNFVGPNVRDVKVTKSDGEYVGALRNRAFDLAKGDYLLTWDDDDWHAPERMAYQATQTPDGYLSCLTNRIIYNWQENAGFYLSKKTGFGSTLLFPRNTTERYPNWLRESDTWFKCMFLNRVFLDNPAALYIYNLHGKNLTPQAAYKDWSKCDELSAADAALVADMKQML